MKQIEPDKRGWPKCSTKKIECRERDLIIRIANWTKDMDEPGYDVEVYIGGVYDWNESRVCETKCKAIEFSKKQIEKLL